MTRKEEIEMAWLARYFQSNHRYDEKTFKEAVEWADKTIIEKVCEWLKDNIFNYPWYDNDAPNFTIDDIINDFRKAMEE